MGLSLFNNSLLIMLRCAVWAGARSALRAGTVFPIRSRAASHARRIIVIVSASSAKVWA